jgi:acyl carrier protein
MNRPKLERLKGQIMTDVITLSKTESQIIDIIAAQAMIDAGILTAQTKLADLALDSLMMVEVVFGLEEAFDVSIPFNANTNVPEFDLSSISSIATAIDAMRA